MDYTPIIREQITRDVVRLHASQKRGHLNDASCVKIGYLINSHKGRPVFTEHDEIDGLPVKITRDHDKMMTITVGSAKSIW